MNTRLALAGLLGFSVMAAGPALALQAVTVGSGYNTPVFVTAPAGDSRLFVVEKAGRIQVQQGATVSTFLDIRTLVDSNGERGLLGLAFDPAYASNGRFYVNYIDRTTLHTVIAGYTAPVPAANTADPASAATILTVAQPAGLDNHKAGWIGFRHTDPGQLYIATGDGGSGNDPSGNAQNLDSNLGKMLRVTPQPGGGYTVPASNPFVGAIAGNDEIWAYGLRNPYRNSFDRSTGNLWIGDVGQNNREEINFETAATPGGRNYGWRAREGTVDNPSVGDSAPAGAVDPLFDYAHGPLGRSVIGGVVYRGSAEVGLDGSYLFGDYVSGRIFSLRESGGVATDFSDLTAALGTPFAAFQLASFGEDGFGNVLAVGLNGNLVQIAAVPEPGSALMWLLGIGALVAGKLRQRHTGHGDRGGEQFGSAKTLARGPPGKKAGHQRHQVHQGRAAAHAALFIDPTPDQPAQEGRHQRGP